MQNLNESLNRNQRFSADLFGIGQNAFTHVRSRAGSNFDINDCFSKDNNIEESFFAGITIKSTFSSS